MTDAQILALARVFDREWIENKDKYNTGEAADMWSRLWEAVAHEIKNMHGKRGQLLFKNYAQQAPETRKAETGE